MTQNLHFFPRSSIGIDLRPHLGQANLIAVPGWIISEYQWSADRSSVSTEHVYRISDSSFPFLKLVGISDVQ